MASLSCKTDFLFLKDLNEKLLFKYLKINDDLMSEINLVYIVMQYKYMHCT